MADRPHLVVVDKPGAPQSVVRYGRQLMVRRDPRYFAGLVANTALGGSFTSRLNNRLREQLGYTYGAGSSFWLGRTSGTWSAGTSLKTENTVDGVREALALIESMRTAELPADELARTKQLLVRRLPTRFETNSQIAGSLADLVGEGIDLGWYAGYAAGVDAVDADRVREFAAASWAPGDQVLVVVGDLEKILDGLLGLGFADAIQVDAEGAVLRTHQAKR
jgi:zinc protease